MRGKIYGRKGYDSMNTNTIKESLETPRNYECDVCVCGGGVAGIAAALAAARAGADVMLLERGFMLGGLATAGLVTIYLPLCDGRGHQICYGLAEELFLLSIEHGAEGRYPKAWLEGGTLEEKAKDRFEVQFNAQFFAISAERLLLKEGVRILYGVNAVAAPVQEGKITDIIIEGKSGREAITIRRSVVDTTGDADICKLSGAKTETYGEGNVLAAWYYGYGNHDFKLYMCGVHDVPDEENDTELLIDRRFTGLDTTELSEMVQISHASLVNNVQKRRKDIPDLVPVTMATIPEVRMTRRLEGAYTMDVTEDGVSYPDTVGIFPNWRKRGPVYELPLSTLYGREVKNLITAGRCISVTDAMWDITRVIPVCAVTGEAAGAAAAMSDDFAAMDLKKLQGHLVKCGMKLHRE